MDKKDQIRFRMAVDYFKRDPRAYKFLQFYFNHLIDFERGTSCQITDAGVSALVASYMPKMEDTDM